MLGKLIKHELYALSRILLVIHGLLILFTLIGRLLLSLGVLEHFPDFVTGIFASMYFVAIFAVSLITQLMIAIRFYKNLFTDEGYLSFTLPVSPASHLHAKWIASALWMFFDFAVILLSFGLISLDAGSLRTLASALTSTYMGSISLLTYLILTYLLCVILTPIFTYFCIVLGQLFGSHRLLGSIVIYFLVTMLQQIIVLVALFIDFPMYELSSTASMGYLFKFIFIFLLVECIIFYLITRYIMTKRINLY